MFQRRIPLVRLLGFEIRFDLTWLIVVALIIWTLSVGYFPAAYADLPTSAYVWMGIVGAAGLFASIVLHELAHSVVGRHLGMDIHGITLFAFGGAAELHEEPATPRVEFLMAIAGPTMSVALAALFYLLGLALTVAEVAEPVVTVLGYLSAINVLLVVFNLLPAFPLDGGRVLRAVLWAWRGDVDWATRIASMVGGAFGLGLMLLGLLAAVRGNLLGGVWWLLIGLFIRATAAASYQRLRMHHMLAGISIGRLMRDEPIVVAPTASAAELVEDYLLGRALKRVPVVEDGRFLGHVGVEEVKALTPEERQRRLVGDIMVPAEPGNTIALDAGAAEDVYKRQSFRVETTHAGLVRAAAGVIAVAMALYHIWAIATGVPEAMLFRGTHLLFAMTLVFLWYRADGAADGRAPAWWDYALLALSATAILYLFVNYSYVVNRIYYVDDLRTADMVLGTLLTVLVLEGTRRVIGLALPITAVVFLAWALAISQVEPERLLDQLYMTTEGIFGPTLGVSATFVMVFVLFGSFMERTGTGQLFMDFALALTGHTAGGPGKVAVVSSSLFGTISGSAVANVMVDGPITIPLMKRSGFKPHFAAAVESVASTGGQIMPPIMGAAAFVMAEFLQVSYVQVTLWALIPAFLYYVACFAAVHFEAKRLGLVGLPRADLPRLGRVFRERGHLFIPILVILGGMYSGYSAPLCALAGTAACFPVAALRANTRGVVSLRNVVEALVDGARNALSVALACACAGIVIGCITLTGLGIVFTQFVIALAQNSLFLALVLTAFAGIVLGMGMPTTPAYIVMTSLLVPAVAKLGAPIPAAHMFAFYFAILSAITPPVALAVYAAASLAKADLWASGWAAVRVGVAGFLVPFAFVYQPAILMIGDWQQTVMATVSATIGVTILAGGLHGYLVRRLALWEQGWLIVAAFLMVDPGVVTDLVGYAMAGIGLAYQYATRTRKAPAWN